MGSKSGIGSSPLLRGRSGSSNIKAWRGKEGWKEAQALKLKLKGLTKSIEKMGAKEIKWKSPKVVPKGGTSKQFAETFRKKLKETTGYNSGGLITGKPKLATKGWK